MSLLREFVQLQLEKLRGGHGQAHQRFDLNAFKQLKTANFKKLLQYADDSLQAIGEGSARKVYALSGQKVLKVATGVRGVGQNEAEVSVYTNPSTQSIVTKIYDYDPNYRWIISEIVRPFVDDETDEINDMLGIGISSLTFEEFANTAARGHINTLEKYGAGHQLELAKAIYAIASENDLLPGDIAKGGSWGKSADGRLVLLDYGFTYDVADNYYGYG